MKNKKILFILLIVIFVVISIFFIIRKNSTSNIIREKGYELFGKEYCDGHVLGKERVLGWDSYSTCRICGITQKNDAPYSDFVICSECSKITRRCPKCGKLEK